MHSEKSMREYYAARAQEYDHIYAKPERQANLRSIENWIPTVLSGRRVIEVACGTGYWTQFFASRASYVVAIDAAAETLEIARKRVTADNIEFHIADAYALPDALGQFDAAFAGFWLSHIPRSRVKTFLVNLHARLYPGSSVLLLDNLYVEGSSHPIVEHDLEGNSYQSRGLLDGTSHRVLKNFPSEGDLLEMIDGLGEKPQYHKLDYYWTFQYEVLPIGAS